jgi:uncharacterized protein (TIGR02145 family)
MKNRIFIILIPLLLTSIKSFGQINWGSFTDYRDLKTYKTIIIGTQTWMAENLCYKASSGCNAYNNAIYNVNTYGYLYNLKTADKVCPDGWHIPSDTEWITLINFLGGGDVAGKKLKSTYGWDGNGTNSSEFSALPGGKNYYNEYNENNTYLDININGYWWSSDQNEVIIYSNDANVSIRSCSDKDQLSIRCIKD